MLKYSIFIRNFITMAELYDKNFSEATVEIYYKTVQDLSNQEFESACMKILMERVFPSFPKPAEFRECVFGSKQLNISVHTIEALTKFRQGIKSGNSVVFDDKLIRSTVETMGGWVYILEKDKEDRKWIEKEFQETYQDLFESNREIPFREYRCLITRDLNNIKNGLEPLQATVVGERTLAVEWVRTWKQEQKLLENKN